MGTTASSHSSTPAISLDETNEDTDTKDDTKFNVELPELRIAITVEYGCVSLRLRFFPQNFGTIKRILPGSSSPSHREGPGTEVGAAHVQAL